MRSEFFFAGMKTQWDEGVRRLLLGDNTGDERGPAVADQVPMCRGLDFKWAPLRVCVCVCVRVWGEGGCIMYTRQDCPLSPILFNTHTHTHTHT